jgi:hypothetical protein
LRPYIRPTVEVFIASGPDGFLRVFISITLLWLANIHSSNLKLNVMHLSTEETELFYDLLWTLHFFVNERLEIIPKLASIQEHRECAQAEKFKVREALYSHPELILTFVKENPYNLPAEHLAIMQEWQYFVKSDFYVERYLKNHAIFIGKQVYGVIGLTQDIEEIIPKYALPQM